MKQLIGILTIIITVACCASVLAEEESPKQLDNTELARKRGGLGFHHGFHGMWHLFGFQALAVLYWLKVKAVIVAFFVGAAAFWGFKYYFAKHNSCHEDIIRDGPIIPFDQGISWSSSPGHDHVPYSLDHSSEHSDHYDSYPTSDPYSGYSSYSDSPSPTQRSADAEGRQFDSEEQISEFMFAFLGINSGACRRRFMCEVEFKSKNNPLTRMAFRIVGRGIFSQYITDGKSADKATSFMDCARVNPDCTFIEENDHDENEEPVVVNNDTESERSLHKSENQKPIRDKRSSSLAEIMFSRSK